MATEIESLILRLEADTTQLRRSMNAGTRSVGRFERRSQRSLSNFDRQMRNVQRRAVRFGAGLAASIGVGFSAQAAGRALDFATALEHTATRIGFTVEGLQEMRFAASDFGIETRQVDIALQRFQRRVGEVAETGRGELRPMLEGLGIELRDANGNIRAGEDVLADYADAVSRLESPQARLLAAFKAFDSEGAALVNVLARGSAGLDEYAARARELGLIMDADMTAKAAEVNRQFDELGQTMQMRFRTGVVGAVPAITEFGDAFSAMGEQAAEGARNIALFARIAAQVIDLPVPDFSGVGRPRRFIPSAEQRQSLESRFAAATAGTPFGGAEDGVPSRLPPAASAGRADVSQIALAQAEALERGNVALRRRIDLVGAASVAQTNLEAELAGEAAVRDALNAAMRAGQTPSEQTLENIRAEASARVQLSAELARQQAALQELQQSAESLAEATITPLERFHQSLAEIRRLADAGDTLDTAAASIGTTRAEVISRSVAAAVEELRADMPAVASDAEALAEAFEGLDLPPGFIAKLANMRNVVKETVDEAVSLSDEIGDRVGGAIGAATRKAFRLRDVLEDIARQIADIIVQEFVVNPVSDFVSAGISTVFGGGGGGVKAPGQSPIKIPSGVKTLSSSVGSIGKSIGQSASPITITFAPSVSVTGGATREDVQILRTEMNQQREQFGQQVTTLMRERTKRGVNVAR